MKLSSPSRRLPSNLTGLFRGVTPTVLGRWDIQGQRNKEVQQQKSTTREKKLLNNTFVVQQNQLIMSNLIEPHCMKEHSTTTKIVAEANHKVSNWVINSSSQLYNHKGSVDTLTLQVSENTPPLIAQQSPLRHELSILGIPILHLTLTQSHPPWIPLMRMGIAPIAAEVCLNQAFVGRISLFQSNWKVLTRDHWVLQTVSEEYHIPLLSHPVQLTPLHNPH